MPPKQVANLLGVSVYTVKRWLKEGKLEGIRLPGGQWRVTEEACKKIMISNQEGNH